MKIHPYLSVIQGQKQVQVRRVPRSKATGDFSQELNKAAAEPRDVVEVVSLENKRALDEKPPSDLGAAEAVLDLVKGKLGQLTKADLGKVHRLEGLVHVFAP